MSFIRYKKIIFRLLDIILGCLALVLVGYMLRLLWEIGYDVFTAPHHELFSGIMKNVLSFFMVFEFVVMLIRYIQEGHHIPIRYIVLIAMTAILRELLVIQHDGVQALLLSLSCLLLGVMLMLQSNFKFHDNKDAQNIDNARD